MNAFALIVGILLGSLTNGVLVTHKIVPYPVAVILGVAVCWVVMAVIICTGALL